MSASEDLTVGRGVVIPASELHESATRSSGPGGQHVNKTSTRVTIRWNVAATACLTATQRRRLESRLASRLTQRGDLIVHADRTRSRARNREEARERLAELVRAALAVRRRRRPTAPSKAARARRVDEKTQRGALKRRRGPVAPDSE